MAYSRDFRAWFKMAAEIEKVALLVVLLLRKIRRRRKAGRTKTCFSSSSENTTGRHFVPSSEVTWVGLAIVLDDPLIGLSRILTVAANDEEFALQGKKYQTCWIFSSRLREANFSPKFRRTREETAEQTVSRGTLLSSFLTCAAGLSKLSR